MKKNYLNCGFALIFILSFMNVGAQIVTQTLSYTGGAQAFTINSSCPTPVTITCYGAQGANGASTSSGAIGGTGGLGAMATGVYTIGANGVLNIYVGGAGTGSIGGFNGGGNGAIGTSGAGGGASDVRYGGNALTDRIIVAGGGGGGGNAGCTSGTITGGAGGAGGGGNGTSGINSIAGGAGQGGVATAGGVGGVGCSCCLGATGGTGVSGLGGNGGIGPNVCAAYVSGGGGGGGYLGGGGGGGGSAGTTSCSLNDQGAGGGGAGGTNYFLPAFTNTSVTNGVRSGNGMVVVSYSATSQSTLTINPTTATVCSGNSITYTASGSSTTYSWSSGVTTNSALVTPTSNTSYTVTSITGAGLATCAAIPAVVNVTVLALPSLTIANSSPTICSGNTATLTATGASLYTWVGVTTVTNGLAFFPTTTGNYTVYGTSAQGCTNTAVTSISVVTTPANFPTSTPTAICLGQTATITVTGATNYTWLPGNINTSTIAVNPTITTTYTVIKSNANCVDTKTFVLNVNNLPGLSIIASNTIVCASNTLQLQGGGAATFTWAPGGITGQSVVVTPSASVIYTLTASNGTCANTATISITTKANPTISLVPSSSVICNGFCSTLTASGGNSYTWTATPASSSSLSGVSVVDCPTTTTSYSVAGSNSLGCVTGAQQIIVVNPLPSFSVAANPPMVCVAANSTISAQSVSGVTYSWSTGASTRTNIVSPLATNVYTCTATFTATQCKNTRTVSVSVFVPTFAITGPTAVCVGGTITINASGSLVANNAYVWSGNGYTSTGFPSFAVSPTVPTIYICTGTGTLSGVICSSTNTVLIGIYQNPTVTAVVDRTLICKGETAYLTGGGAATYLWNTNQTGSTVPVAPTANSTTYTVVGTDANGCDGTATVQVRSQSCIGIKENTLNQTLFVIYPNPSNGEFTIESDAPLNLQIVDELGRSVQSVSIKEINGFEAKVNGLKPGVYFIVGEKGNQKVHQKIIIQ